MVASYDPSLTIARDRVRLVLGDTDTAAPLRPDATYDAAISDLGEAGATAYLAEGLATQYAQEPDSYGEAGGITVSWRDRVKAWLELAKRTRESMGATDAAISAATTSRTPVRAGTLPEAEYVRPGWWTPE